MSCLEIIKRRNFFEGKVFEAFFGFMRSKKKIFFKNDAIMISDAPMNPLENINAILGKVDFFLIFFCSQKPFVSFFVNKFSKIHFSSLLQAKAKAFLKLIFELFSSLYNSLEEKLFSIQRKFH